MTFTTEVGHSIASLRRCVRSGHRLQGGSKTNSCWSSRVPGPGRGSGGLMYAGLDSSRSTSGCDCRTGVGVQRHYPQCSLPLSPSHSSHSRSGVSRLTPVDRVCVVYHRVTAGEAFVTDCCVCGGYCKTLWAEVSFRNVAS